RGLHLTRVGPKDIIEDGVGLLGGEHPEVDRVPPDGVARWTPVLQRVPLLSGQREPGLHVMDREVRLGSTRSTFWGSNNSTARQKSTTRARSWSPRATALTFRSQHTDTAGPWSTTHR